MTAAPALALSTVRLDGAHWRRLEREHQERADDLTAAHRARRQRGETHAVEDFLFTYYSFSPAELRRWHPGAGVTLEGTTGERTSWRYYTDSADLAGPACTLDLAAYFEKRGGTVGYVDRLLTATLERPPRFGCFGLHEWAMVYRMTPEQLRHSALPLRIGHAETDLVVESHPIACSHFDAYRFFTPESAPLNELQPTRDTQIATEQAGCLHAGMDVYKWASKLGPIIPGALLLDCFELARDIRTVDMQASPYDVSSLGLPAIPIETPVGKREYARRQRGFTERGNTLRQRILSAIDTARAAA